jgi:acetylornithine deacetylase/succinyl-diaminopimelate desuccinylase-like protein
MAALGDLMQHIEIVDVVGASFSPANVSPMDTPLFEVLAEVIDEAYPGAVPLPIIAAGGSDARFYRARGRRAYGFSVLSRRWDYGRFRHLIHGNDEHIDLESVTLTARALDSVVRRFLG